MSGRSAFVRKTTEVNADSHAMARYQRGAQGDDFRTFDRPFSPLKTNGQGYISPQLSPTLPPEAGSGAGDGYAFAFPPRQHGSVVVASGHQRIPVRRVAQPIIIASAVEKSDFRTHLDGMSTAVRGKLGKLLGVKDAKDKAAVTSRPGTSVDDLPPSLEALPPLVPSSPTTARQVRVCSYGSTSSASVHSATRRPSLQHGQQTRQAQQEPQVCLFFGGGKKTRSGWKSLSTSPELMDPNGDTLVYMYSEGQMRKPMASFRVDSKVLVDMGSAHFIRQIRQPSVPQGWPAFPPGELPCDGTSVSGRSSPEPAISPTEFSRDSFAASVVPSEYRIDPDSEDLSHDLPPRIPPGVLHELYVAYPGEGSGLDAMSWHLATRNFFAMVYDADSLCGKTLFDALKLLHARLVHCPEYLAAGADPVDFVTAWLLRHKFDDLRSNPTNAASLLAFGEQPGVRWRDGYVEAFVHCVGMFKQGVAQAHEWSLVSQRSRLLIEHAGMEAEIRVRRAERFLAEFDFPDLWPKSVSKDSGARAAYERMRTWLCRYFAASGINNSQWPPAANAGGGVWLNRTRTCLLRDAFNSLFDYLVDRDVVFDGTRYRPGQRWQIVHRSGQAFYADMGPAFPLTDMLLDFDNAHAFPHMPSPYPMRPESVPASKRSLLSSKGERTVESVEMQRRALSYSDASNIYSMSDVEVSSDFVTRFNQFEREDQIEHVNPCEARLGRWVLIYAVLQVLATVGVDAPAVRHERHCAYHLNASLKGVVPWAEAGAAGEEEPAHELSHPFTAPTRWAQTIPKARKGSHAPIIWGQYGDGRANVPRDDADVAPEAADPWPGLRTPVRSASLSGTESSGPRSSTLAQVTEEGEEGYEDSVASMRRKRAILNGFTNYKPPEDW